MDGTKELHVTLSPRTPAGDPPETEELIKALMVNADYTNNNNPAEFVSSAIKYFIHTKIHVESMRRNGKRFHNSDTSTLFDIIICFVLTMLPLTFSRSEFAFELTVVCLFLWIRDNLPSFLAMYRVDAVSV